ncbi:MAG TPA: glutamate racemase [Caldithrix abyssi]|uniref:Glutamate racemase n=1 Tax=Caldithrix abyssi TaxID=187145 RepID=A0A7V5RNM4_CALAY|nr:glutamate racemase [Caldithrix abyssi]
MKNDRPIGIFDSGIGGLTVLRQLRKLLPDEQLIYFGDTARIPYGTKSKTLIQRYAMEDAAFLLQFDVKMIVVACNTASALAMDVLKRQLPVPVTGVIQPGALAAVRQSKTKQTLIMGTSATVRSGAYSEAIHAHDPDFNVVGRDCPLLVPLVEEGWLDDPVTMMTLHKYLDPVLSPDIDSLILGCTHYPLLAESIQKVTGDSVQLIDSGFETAYYVRETLERLNLRNTGRRGAGDQFYVSDIPQKFADIGARFLGESLAHLKRVDFENFLVEHNSRIEELLRPKVEE